MDLLPPRPEELRNWINGTRRLSSFANTFLWINFQAVYERVAKLVRRRKYSQPTDHAIIIIIIIMRHSFWLLRHRDCWLDT